MNSDAVYQASVTFFVRTSGEGNVGAAAQADLFAQTRVNSYAALLRSDRFAEKAIDEFDLDVNARTLSGMIEATGAVDTVLLTATVTSGSEAEAGEIAAAVAESFPAMVSEVEGQGVGDTSVSLEVISGPTVRLVPPDRKITLATRILLGAAVGVLGAVLLQLRDRSVTDADEVVELGLGPVLGSIPVLSRGSDEPLVVYDDPGILTSEAFRQLRTNLKFLDAERPLGTLVVTSSVAGEGKSVTSANLSLALAAAGGRVLVIEADLRRPSTADLFGLDRAAGLTDVLIGRASPEQVMQPWGHDGLTVLPSGQLPPNPTELLGGDAMVRLLDKLRHEFDAVVLDTPPALLVSDAAVVGAHADGVLVVARSGRTNRKDLRRTHDSLAAVNARVLGTVLTFVPARRRETYGSYASHEMHKPKGTRTGNLD